MVTYEELIDDLCNLHEQRAYHEGRRIRSDVTIVHGELARGHTVAAAERAARMVSLEDLLAVVDIDAKIAGLLLRKELLERVGP
jgi:hypothetical protein